MKRRTPPFAYVRGRGGWSRLVARVVEPPRWASSLFAWSLSGAFVAGVGNVLAFMARHGGLGEMRLLSSLAVTSYAVLGVIVLFLPFLVSGGLFSLLVARRTAARGACWCIGFHVTAHALVMRFVDTPIHHNLVVPVLVGGLWGLWLSRADHPDEY